LYGINFFFIYFSVIRRVVPLNVGTISCIGSKLSLTLDSLKNGQQ